MNELSITRVANGFIVMPLHASRCGYLPPLEDHFVFMTPGQLADHVRGWAFNLAYPDKFQLAAPTPDAHPGVPA